MSTPVEMGKGGPDFGRAENKRLRAALADLHRVASHEHVEFCDCTGPCELADALDAAYIALAEDAGE